MEFVEDFSDFTKTTVKIERIADEIEATEGDKSFTELYCDHEIKEEMVIGPEVLQSVPEIKKVIDECLKESYETKEGNKKKKIYPCEYCCRIFSKESSLVRHRKIHTKGKSFPSNSCNQIIEERKNHVKSSKKTKSKAKRGIFPCHECDIQFTFQSGLLRHTKTKHSVQPQMKRFSCETCNKSYLMKSHLVQHMDVHTNKLYPCDICHKKFNMKRNLVMHLNTIHTDVKKFSCEPCNKKFTRKCNLDVHNILIHLNPKTFTCEFCTKKFRFEISLVKHLRKCKRKKIIEGLE